VTGETIKAGAETVNAVAEVPKTLIEIKKAQLEVTKLKSEANERESLITRATFEDVKKYDRNYQNLVSSVHEVGMVTSCSTSYAYQRPAPFFFWKMLTYIALMGLTFAYIRPKHPLLFAIGLTISFCLVSVLFTRWRARFAT
jgi:hypothetical protein